MTYERGQIRRREHALVERDFRGLVWKKISPTDIDAFVEFGDRLMVFVEAKLVGAKLIGGQRLALERLCDACDDNNKPRVAIAFVVSTDGSDRFDYATAQIVEYRWRRRWRRPKTPITLKPAIDRLHKKYVGNVVEYRDLAAWRADYERHERDAK